ncbi:MAG TPA: signal peptidase I [Terracidiphilus sp.]|nr:signal peptidase I [Terracidiphilus sp.]
MTQKNSTSTTPDETQKDSAEQHVEETPFEALASICSVLVVGLYILTFIAQNFVIPSGSMEKTLLVGDHLVVDRITLAPPAKWMPLMYYREPKRNDIVVFIKPVPDPDAEGNPQYLYLVKRLIGVPGDHIHLHNGIVYVNGVAQVQPHAQPTTPENYTEFLDEFPEQAPPDNPQVPDSWSKVEFPKDVVDGNLVVPPGMYFMMGDNRHNSLDSRYWGFMPRANVVGRPLFNYWSFKSTEAQYEQTGFANGVRWMGHVALHFFTETRWPRTLHRVR